MSAIQIKVLPRNTTYSTDSVARGLAAFLFVGSILIVLFAGTFPFDFSASAGSLAQQVQRKFDPNPNPWDPGFIDRSENILFFLPFGFALASVIRARRMRRLIQIVGAAVLSLIL